jgi:prepilin-type N-terminal cleavage/methylation domain-containing protein
VTKRLGFTMLELIIVLLLLGVFLSIAAPSASAMRHQYEVRGSSQRFAAKHGLARAVAVRMGRTAQLRVDTAGSRVWIEVLRSPTVRDTVGPIDYFNPRLGFHSNRTRLCFDARGLAKTGGTCEAPGATVIFSLGGRADTVEVTPFGRVVRP